MFGVPGQSLALWQRSVEALVALAPEHVSAYALTVEPRDRLRLAVAAGPARAPRRRGHRGHVSLGPARPWPRPATRHYEVSSYARPGFRAVHNQLYWTQAAYLGVGASAASFRPLVDGSGWRFSNPRSTETYLRASPSGAPAGQGRAARSPADLENEALWLGCAPATGSTAGAPPRASAPIRWMRASDGAKPSAARRAAGWT